jgi:hypothetical protein
MKVLACFIFCIYLSGCDFFFSGAESVNFPPIIIPQDQATASERAAVEHTLDLISKYAAEFGEVRDFRQLPIVLRVRDNPTENVAGRCHYNYDMRGFFIEIFKDVIPILPATRAGQFSSELFIVLLHEIGHCYFSRPHDPALIKRVGFEMVFSVSTDSGDNDVYYYEIPASIMIDTWSIGIPKDLERYYVGEILGVFRANTPEELQSFVEFRIQAHEPREHGIIGNPNAVKLIMP